MHEHTRHGRGRTAGAAIVALLTLTWLPADAHHGWEDYRDEDFEIAGTVESPVTVAGPHASLEIRVDGQVWNIVLGPPPRTERAGLKSGMIPAGAEVTVYGHRHRDPKRLEVKTERLRWDDRVFDVYPDRT